MLHVFLKNGHKVINTKITSHTNEDPQPCTRKTVVAIHSHLCWLYKTPLS